MEENGRRVEFFRSFWVFGAHICGDEMAVSMLMNGSLLRVVIVMGKLIMVVLMVVMVQMVAGGVAPTQVLP